ncbi:MAG: tetratricopeptide repeat protein, partial [Verrucomicrobiota bacterium]
MQAHRELKATLSRLNTLPNTTKQLPPLKRLRLHRELAETALKMKAPAEAVHYLDSAISIKPAEDSVPFLIEQLALTQMSTRAGKDIALPTFHEIWQRIESSEKPTKQDSQILLLRILCEQIQSLNRQDSMALLDRVNTFSEQWGLHPSAVSYSAKLTNMAGGFHLEAKQFGEAEDSFERSLNTLLPLQQKIRFDPVFFYQLGRAHKGMGFAVKSKQDYQAMVHHYSEAYRNFAIGLELLPRDKKLLFEEGQTLRMLASAYARYGYADEAEKLYNRLFERAQSETPPLDDPLTYGNLALLLDRKAQRLDDQGDYKLAEETFRRAIQVFEASPTQSATHRINLSKTQQHFASHLKKNAPDEAIELLTS